MLHLTFIYRQVVCIFLISSLSLSTAFCLSLHKGEKADPPTISVKEISATTAKIYWVANNNSSSVIRYRIQGEVQWTTINAGSENFFEVRGLKPGTNYEVAYKAIDADESEWSATTTFKTRMTPTGPNMLVIVLDDSRYDPFGATTGGHFFMPTPAIDRIGNEGVNFTYCFPALSLCGPSRASIVTGLYPHHHGVYDNSFVDTMPHITIAQILHDAGYYTGWVGKYGFEKFPIPGYDYWLQSSSDQYFNSLYQYNGSNVGYPDHKTNVFTWKALEFLNSVPPGEKFMLFLDHKAPHVPYDPRPEEDGIYDGIPMPVPPSFFHYDKNYPSHYYECNNGETDTVSFSDNARGYFELLAGAEWSVDTILQYLDDHNLTDSTMIIFTSDNGLLKSEHFLSGKELALDPSLRLPMFIRYPKWFTAGTRIDSEMVMNIDIAPTMLDAAGIPDTFGMDGVSMKSIYDQTFHRKELFYEFFNRYDECNPTFTAIRDFRYKLIQNKCLSAADEFYDLALDSNENVNLINNESYFELIDTYRGKLDSLKQVYDYINIRDTIVGCQLLEPDSSIGVGIPSISDFASGELKVYPNPVHNILNVHLEIPAISSITIENIIGQTLYQSTDESNDGEILKAIPVADMLPGIYLLKVLANGKKASIPFVKY